MSLSPRPVSQLFCFRVSHRRPSIFHDHLVVTEKLNLTASSPRILVLTHPQPPTLRSYIQGYPSWDSGDTGCRRQPSGRHSPRGRESRWVLWVSNAPAARGVSANDLSNFKFYRPSRRRTTLQRLCVTCKRHTGPSSCSGCFDCTVFHSATKRRHAHAFKFSETLHEPQ